MDEFWISEVILFQTIELVDCIFRFLHHQLIYFPFDMAEILRSYHTKSTKQDCCWRWINQSKISQVFYDVLNKRSLSSFITIFKNEIRYHNAGHLRKKKKKWLLVIRKSNSSRLSTELKWWYKRRRLSLFCVAYRWGRQPQIAALHQENSKDRSISFWMGTKAEYEAPSDGWHR